MAPSATGHSGRIAQVVPLLRLHHLGGRRFDYLIPEDLPGAVGRGSMVTVPFGKRTVQAVVLQTGPSADTPAAAADLRAIEALAPDSIAPELVDLAEEVAARYLCSLESCLRLVAPIGAASGKARPAVVRTDYVRRVAETGGDEAVDAAAAEPTAAAQPAETAAGATAGAIAAVKLTAKQQAALDAIPADGIARKELCDLAGVGRGVLDTLEKKGLIESCAGPGDGAESGAADAGDVAGAGAGAAAERDGGLTLWPEQEQAVAEMTAALDSTELETRLLWGVTGSGKTEVYLRVMEQALARGRGAILLVPEIALTPQTIRRVKARFGGRVGVFHSGLPHGERLRDYRRVAAGAARLVVGARSAVFAPVKDLGLIIIDEAHDNSYKQEEEPRYRVKTVAEMRLRRHGGLLVEGSATPLVESMDRPEERIRLSVRASGAPPEIEVVDMRRQGAGLLLAPRSRNALAEVLREGEQAIILLNRRGFAGYVHCDACGHVLMCDDCELSLTYHQGERRLLCHSCGRAYSQPAACPECGEAPLTRAAPGTERLDGELRTVVPGDQVFRMDSDVAGNAARTQAILQAFGDAKPGVLVGTQMVAKGHDFPDVTLVIVADADVGLYIPDFRASERTFQLITQVAGRAGRAKRPGRVLVQTSNPDVPCIRMALASQEEEFYQDELAGRQRLGYPPYTEIIRLLTSSPEPEKAQAAARHLVERLAPYFAGRELHGPAPLPRLRGRHRWQLMVAAHQGERARTIIGKALEQLEGPYRRRGVTLLVDVDPLSFS